MKHLILNIFFACGGVVLVWKFVGSNTREYVHKGLGFLFHKFPLFRSFVVHNWDRILAIGKEAGLGIQDAEEEAAKENP